jgi:hypothetical protein
MDPRFWASDNGPVEHLFAIDDMWLYPCSGRQEEPVPVVGYTLAGEPVRQGFPILTFTRDFLRQSDMTALANAYDLENPLVTIRFVSKRTGNVIAVHFTDTVGSGPDAPPMSFDYRLRPGVATTTNAFRLMRLIGLELDESGDERETDGEQRQRGREESAERGVASGGAS